MSEQQENPVKETTADGAETSGEAKVPVTKIEGRDWRGWILFLAGAGSILWGLFAAVGSGWGLWNWTSGFTGVQWSFFLALAALLTALLFFWWDRRTGQRGNRMLRFAGTALALVYAGWIVSYIIQARSVPAIHDISTDLADPPQFRALTLRDDNWENIPTDCDGANTSMTPQQRWRICHQNAYGDVRSVRVDMPVAEVIKKAERLAEDRDWEIASVDVRSGRLEATDTTSLFRFRDDVVIRARPVENGDGSIVDMRSVSRVGVSDLGVNAKRVRGFLADLSGTVTTE